MSIFKSIKRFLTPKSRTIVGKEVIFDDVVMTTIIMFADGHNEVAEERAIGETITQWHSDHMTKMTTWHFESFGIHTSKEHVTPVKIIEFSGDVRTTSTTYGDGWVDRIDVTATDTEVSYSEDEGTKTTTYTFTDGEIHSVEEADDRTSKEKATDACESYIDVVNLDLEKDDLSKGFFELDWNTDFVDDLRTAGYTGKTEEDVVDQWFTELCTSIVRDTAMDGVINPSNLSPRQFKRDDGLTEYR